jgi:hypothetical protein
MSTAELKDRINFYPERNYYIAEFQSPSGKIYGGICNAIDAIKRAQNENLSERAKDKSGLTLRQALDQIYYEATYPDTHDENGVRTVWRIK